MKLGRSHKLKSIKYLEKRRKKIILNTLFIFIVSILILVFLISLTRLPFLQIKNIKINGLVTLDSIQLQKEINNILTGYYGYIIPKSNFIFFPKDEIIKRLYSNYKKIDSIKLYINGTLNLNADIIERTPEVIVCNGFRGDENIDSCFFADKTGYVFDKFSTFYSGVYIKYYFNTNLAIQPGIVFMDQIKFNELQKFITNLSISGIKSSGILINEDQSYELYIDNKKEGTAVVYFDNRTSLDKTFSNLITFWQNSGDNFEYINLRFGNNIFYRLK